MILRILLALLLAPALACASLACSGDGTAGEEPPSETGAAPDVGGVLAAIEVIEGADLHGQNQALKLPETTAIHPAWLGPVLRARTATVIVEWPHAVRDRVDAFLAALEPYVAALEADDLEAARAAVAKAHNAYHALTGGAYDVLAELAELTGDSGGGHH